MEADMTIPVVTLQKAINDEATAIAFYDWLLSVAPDTLAKSFIEHARNDEKEHLEMFTNLYLKQTGRNPQPQVGAIPTRNYREALEAALKAELGAQEFYRKIYLASTNPNEKNSFYIAMLDEIEHAIRFSTLLSLASH
jgi:rubrerythrin